MPLEHFNDDTSICSYSVYPDKKDQRQKSDNILQTVFKIFKRQEGKESVALTRILSHISYNLFSSILLEAKMTKMQRGECLPIMCIAV